MLDAQIIAHDIIAIGDQCPCGIEVWPDLKSPPTALLNAAKKGGVGRNALLKIKAEGCGHLNAKPRVAEGRGRACHAQNPPLLA